MARTAKEWVQTCVVGCKGVALEKLAVAAVLVGRLPCGGELAASLLSAADSPGTASFVVPT